MQSIEHIREQGLAYVNRLHPEYRMPGSWLPTMDKKNYRTGDDEKDTLERTAAMEMAKILGSRDRFGAFMEYCFRNEETGEPFEQQWFHDEWDQAMTENNRLIIVGPRDHGKTSQIVGRSIWELGRNPNMRQKIICASDGRAKERLYEVKQHIEHNKAVHAVFPHLREAADAEWSKHKIIVERTARHRDASLEAIGITSTATGGRADLLLPDDVVDRRNALSFPAMREQIKQAWKSDWTNLLESQSRVWYICTLWHKDDLSHQLLENPIYKKLMYTVPDDFGSLWPDKWPSLELWMRFMEIGSVEFNRGFRNIAVDLESVIVHPRWIRFCDLRNDHEFMSRLDRMVFITSYDTAGTPRPGKKTQDFAAGIPFAVDVEARKVYVMSAWEERISVKEQAMRAINDARRYEPFKMLVEKVGQSDVDEWILNEAPELAGILEIVTPKISKKQRLLGVTPLLENGQVIFDASLDPDNEIWTPGRGSLIHQLLDFPFTKHDDLVDAFSQGLHAVRRYFLDWGATAGENIIDVTVGPDTGEDSYLL